MESKAMAYYLTTKDLMTGPTVIDGTFFIFACASCTAHSRLVGMFTSVLLMIPCALTTIQATNTAEI